MYCYTDRQTKRSVPVEVRPPVVRRVDFPEVDVQRRPRSTGYGADAVLHLRRADDDVAGRSDWLHAGDGSEWPLPPIPPPTDALAALLSSLLRSAQSTIAAHMCRRRGCLR